LPRRSRLRASGSALKRLHTRRKKNGLNRKGLNCGLQENHGRDLRWVLSLAGGLQSARRRVQSVRGTKGSVDRPSELRRLSRKYLDSTTRSHETGECASPRGTNHDTPCAVSRSLSALRVHDRQDQFQVQHRDSQGNSSLPVGTHLRLNFALFPYPEPSETGRSRAERLRSFPLNGTRVGSRHGKGASPGAGVSQRQSWLPLSTGDRPPGAFSLGGA